MGSIDELGKDKDFIKRMKKSGKAMVSFFQKASKNYELAEYFRYCAEVDYTNAKILKREGNKRSNATVVYLIQQSIEKYCKAYALVLGAVNKKKLYGKGGIGHNSAKAFVYALTNEDLFETIESLKEISPLIMEEENPFGQINLREESKSINYMIERNIGGLKRTSIKNIIDNYEENRRSLISYSQSREFENEFMKPFKENMFPFLGILYTSKKLSVFKELFIIQFSFIIFLVPISMVTWFYEADTRYPPLRSKQWGPKDFNTNKKQIVNQSERIIEKLEVINTDLIKMIKPIKTFNKMSSTKKEKVINKFLGNL